MEFPEPELTYSEFLSSDILTLATENSERTFKIHKALLESKSKGLFSRVGNFREGSEKIYRFQDTSENTLLRFIQWAYTGAYPENIKKSGLTSTNATQTSIFDDGTTAGENPLNCHMQMYIFAHVYQIWRLESQAYERITNRLKTIEKPKDAKLKREVISMMNLGFKKIHRNDRLLKWLGNYASFCLGELRAVPEFQELLEEVPSFSLAMLKYLQPASTAPWDQISTFGESSALGKSSGFGGSALGESSAFSKSSALGKSSGFGKFSGFGSPPVSTTQSQQPSGLFGARLSPAPSGSLFVDTTPPAPLGFSFGRAPSPAPSGSLFGQATSAGSDPAP